MKTEEKSIKEVLAAAQTWAAAFNKQDPEACSRMYEDNARMLAAPFGEVLGQANIKEFWAKMIADGLSDVQYLNPTVEIIAPDTAHLSSPWAMNAARGIIHREVWKRQTDGRWLLHDDSFEVLDQLSGPAGPTEVVLVHGAWMGGWCWQSVTDTLSKIGIKVTVVDLPAHGVRRDDSIPRDLSAYTEHVANVIKGCAHPIVLVGHSFGGVVVSQVAEMCPELVRGLVYVSGFMLPDGASFMSATAGMEGSCALDNLEFSEDQTHVRIAENVLHDAVAHDVPLKRFTEAAKNIVMEPCAPLASPLHLTPARFGRVPRYYVECTEDKALPLDIQRAMQKTLPVSQVFSLASSHASMFSHPVELANCLATVANK